MKKPGSESNANENTYNKKIMYFGSDITRNQDYPLVKVSEESVVEKLKSSDLKEKIDRLRNLKNVNNDAYQAIKKTLPYFIGASFDNNIRQTKYFLGIDYLVLDLDHLNSPAESNQIKEILIKDNRVRIAFVSPSGQGLKVVFALKTTLKSFKRYTDFYKVFSRSFASQYKIEKYIDFKTSDVTRICFLSYDFEVYYNPNASAVDAELYFDNFFLMQKSAEVGEGKLHDEENQKNKSTSNKDSLAEETYKKILTTLNPKTPKRSINYIVPKQLLTIKDKLVKGITDYKFMVAEIREINYGLKFSIAHNNHKAHINVYYGKRGFSIVKQPHPGHLDNFYDAVELIFANIIFSPIYEKEIQEYA